AANEFQPILDSVPFQDAQIPVLSNVDPMPSMDAVVLKTRLSQQMTGSVRWREISLQLQSEGVETVREIGPGKVLTGLIKRTCKGVGLRNVSDLGAIAA
ncbi:MAG: ACP S-malonyltransferase, partial [Merismopedia sp. SIO2A8]|nr:ACP S-malonyltransferase [Merismopedia sp. SIO2A8]